MKQAYISNQKGPEYVVFLVDMLESVRNANSSTNLCMFSNNQLKQVDTVKVNLSGGESKTIEILANTVTMETITIDHTQLLVEKHAYAPTYIHTFFYIYIHTI